MPLYIAHRMQQFIDCVAILFDGLHPLLLYILLRKYILETCPLRAGADGRGKYLFLIEWRIEVDEIDALAIYSSQYL